LPPDRSRGWLMRMGFRATLAVVVASVLFAVAWPVCDQLAGLGVGGSSAVAGLLAIVAFGLTLRTTRPERVRVPYLRSAHDRPRHLGWQVEPQPHELFVEPTARSGDGGRQLPEKPVTTVSSAQHARDVPARERVRTLVTDDIEFIVDDVGMRVRGKRRTVGGAVWEERLRIQWSAVTGIGFSTGRHDPVVALYTWAMAGKPHYVADSRFLSNAQWIELGQLITEATRGRLTLDVASRHNPKSIWPDW